jgi:predicted Zn-dependent protease
VPSLLALRATALSLGLIVLAAGCLNAPVSNRKQFVAIPEQEEIKLGTEAWADVKSREQPTQNAHYADLVAQVGRRIAAVSGRPDYQWEFQVFESEEANAFALPGGKVAVYEGILPICENEAGLAVVMSHEIAHVLARHGGERMSQEAAAKVGGGLLGKAMSKQPAGQQERWLGAYGAASKYGVLLPYSRTHECEADSIGLTLMAQAGYDPSEAPKFWERFAQMSGPKPPEFLSTHPSDEHRAAELRGLLPRAMAIYQASPDKVGTGIAIGRPPANVRSGNAVQLAGGEVEASPQRRVQPAVFTAVDVDEFLPPITRTRTPASAEPAGAGIDVTEPEPAPFPSAPKTVEANGWTPAN